MGCLRLFNLYFFSVVFRIKLVCEHNLDSDIFKKKKKLVIHLLSVLYIFSFIKWLLFLFDFCVKKQQQNK